MPKPTILVKVSTYDTELNFTIQRKTTGQSLFDQVIKTTGLREVWYFGLQYTDVRNQQAWLNMDKKVSKQDVKQEPILKFQFKFKFFPENIADEIIQDNTLKLLYLQTKSDILNEVIYCPPEKAVLMASYHVQSKYLAHNSDDHGPGYLANDKLLPATVISQHKLTMEEWESKVSKLHRDHRMMSREQAMLEYLKMAQDLEMFGISYFPILNKKGSELMLGVDALGINVYDKGNKLAPKISFPWSEIKKISHSGEKFKVRLSDKSSIPFEGKCKELKAAKKIYELCDGNHTMYIRRRKPDTLEVQQMKEQKREQERQKALDRAALKREVDAREAVERARCETEAKFEALQREMDSYKTDLDRAQAKIRELEDKLREAQESREEMERGQEELRAMMTKLEADRDMEVEERKELENQIRERQDEIDAIRQEVEAKEEAAMKLKEEMDEANRKMQESAQALADKAEQQTTIPIIEENGFSRKSSTSSSSSSEDENVSESVVAKGDEERQPDVKTDELLKSLRNELQQKFDKAKETDDDRQHLQNVSQGRDKFKTLRDIRLGNTKRRIDNFENM